MLRGRVERQCLEYYARRADACIVEQLPGVDALLARDAEGTRYELYLVELTAGNAPAGLKAADTLRRHGARAPLAFFAHTPAHAYNAYRVDACSTCCCRSARSSSPPCWTVPLSRSTARSSRCPRRRACGAALCEHRVPGV